MAAVTAAESEEKAEPAEAAEAPIPSEDVAASVSESAAPHAPAETGQAPIVDEEMLRRIVTEVLREELRGPLGEKRAALLEAFAAVDTGGTGEVGYEVIQDALSSNDLELNDQVLITLMRRFDTDHTGMVKYNELLSV